jgi:hypothetical protein
MPRAGASLVPVGTRVVLRPGRGPSMIVWLTGEVESHEGTLHRVKTSSGNYWCEVDDLLPESSERERALTEGERVWALWLDGRWYPGTVDGRQGRLRHITWDDGDAMWVEPSHIVLLAAEAGSPEVGQVVVARRWNGESQPARVEQQDGDNFKVVFADGEESWVSPDEVSTFPPNPFRD